MPLDPLRSCFATYSVTVFQRFPFFSCPTIESILSSLFPLFFTKLIDLPSPPPRPSPKNLSPLFETPAHKAEGVTSPHRISTKICEACPGAHPPRSPRSPSSRPRASALHQGEFASVVRLPRDASPAQFASPLLTVYQRPRAFLLFARVSFNSFARPRGFIRATEDALPPSLSLPTPGGFSRDTLSNLSPSNFHLA